MRSRRRTSEHDDRTRSGLGLHGMGPPHLHLHCLPDSAVRHRHKAGAGLAAESPMSICPRDETHEHEFTYEHDGEAYCDEHGIRVLSHPSPDGVDMGTVTCPHCHTEMPPSLATPGRWYCTTCPRYALDGDTAEVIEQHYDEHLRALALLDAALGPRAVEREQDKKILTEMETTMGQGIATKGCSNCGGTMYKTYETDDAGNPTSETNWICGGCGHME